MARTRVHALEGRSATGQRYFMCGRTGCADGHNHVGVAGIKNGIGLTGVTCAGCQMAISRRFGRVGRSIWVLVANHDGSPQGDTWFPTLEGANEAIESGEVEGGVKPVEYVPAKSEVDR